MEPFLERLNQITSEAITRLKVRSAINPALWLCGLTLPFSFAGVFLTDGPTRVTFLILMWFPIVVAAFAFIYLLMTNPDKLRSEEYELRKMALQLVEEKGGAISLSEISVEAIANPTYKQLPKLDDGGGT